MGESHLDTLAHDLFSLIESARSSNLDMADGFQSTPLNGPHVFLNYLFYPKDQLVKQGGVPKSFQQKLKKNNVLATIDLGDKKLGIYVLCAFDKEFAQIESPDELLEAMNKKDAALYSDTIREVLKADLAAHMGKGKD